MDLSRRKTRYWLFRLKTEADGGVAADEIPPGVRDVFEEQTAFQLAGGWTKFGISWDVGVDDYHEIIPLKVSLWAAWEGHCARAAKEFPKAVRNVTQAPANDFIDHAEVDALLKRE